MNTPLNQHGSTPRTVTPGQASRQLPASEALSKVKAWDAGRSGQSGINKRPLPVNAQLRQASNGHYVMSTPSGRNFGLSPDGKIRAYQYGGTSAALDAKGRLQAVRSKDMLITRNATGQRHVESRDAQGGFIYSTGAGRGFVERPVQGGGNTLIERTTVSNQNVVITHYQSFRYQNTVLENYVPDTQYSPGFYLWLSRPWSKSVAYTPEDGDGEPAAYGTYFQPEKTYNSSSMWVADQVISSELPEPASSNDAATLDDPAPPTTFEDLPRIAAPQTTPISHQEKVGFAQQFTEVMHNDALAAKAVPNSTSGPARAPSPIQTTPVPAAFDASIQYYFVDDGLDVKTARGEGHCTLSKGDALHRVASISAGATEADLLVESNQKGDCPAGQHVLVAIKDLQAMNNHCHESMSAAVGKFVTEEGRDGLPLGPPSGATQRADLPRVDLTSRGEEAKKAIAEQQEKSTQLEASTQQDIQTGLE